MGDQDTDRAFPLLLAVHGAAALSLAIDARHRILLIGVLVAVDVLAICLRYIPRGWLARKPASRRDSVDAMQAVQVGEKRKRKGTLPTGLAP